MKLVKAAIAGFRIEVSNTVRLHDEYLFGIGEMPSSWPLEALRAQVIASRTYALNKVGKVKKVCDCDIYSSTLDQSFVGYSKEMQSKFGKIWRDAVLSTATDSGSALAVLYKGAPISTYFFSSSGGNTANAVDVWGSKVAYAVSVPDPWSLDPLINPGYARWLRSVDQAAAAAAFSLPDVLSLKIRTRNLSGTVKFIVATSSTGVERELTGGAFANKVRLPSAWFDFAGATGAIGQPSTTTTPAPKSTPNFGPAPGKSPTTIDLF